MREAFGGQQFVIRGAPTRRMRGYHEGAGRHQRQSEAIRGNQGHSEAITQGTMREASEGRQCWLNTARLMPAKHARRFEACGRALLSFSYQR